MSVQSDIKKTFRGMKKLSKETKKLSNIINKKITKAVKKRANKKQKEKRKKERARNKEIEKQSSLLDMVNENLKTAKDRMLDAEQHEIPAYSSFNPFESKRNLDRLKDKLDKGKLLTKKEVKYLKMASNKTYYDHMIKYQIDDDTLVLQTEINRIRNKQTKKPLTEKEQNILNKWAGATERANNVNGADKVKAQHFSPDSGQQPGETEDEYIERRKKEVRRIKVNREITVGGNSRLINDLWYTYECGEIGKKVFNLVQNAMRDPVAWNDIEAWYRKNLKAQDALQARGNDWYESVVHGFLTMFIDFLDELSEKIQIDDEIIAEYETQLAEYIG